MKNPTEQFEFGLGEGDGEALPNSATQRTQPTASVPASTPTELFNAHLEQARKIAWGFKKPHNSAHHDDLDQAARIALYRASEAFRPEHGRAFAPYASRAVKNALTDFYRKTRRIGTWEEFSLDAPAKAAGSGEAGGDGAAWKDNWADAEAEIASLEAAVHESSELLHSAIASLIPAQRAVVEAVLAGRTFSEIAEERGVTKQAANNTFQRALVQIKNELHAMGVKGLESNAGVLHETPARYRFTLNSARVSTDGLEKPVLGSEAQGAVDSATAEAPVPVSPAPAVVPIPAPLAEAMPPITPAPKGWWARLLGWWRSRR